MMGILPNPEGSELRQHLSNEGNRKTFYLIY